MSCVLPVRKSDVNVAIAGGSCPDAQRETGKERGRQRASLESHLQLQPNQRYPILSEQQTALQSRRYHVDNHVPRDHVSAIHEATPSKESSTHASFKRHSESGSVRLHPVKNLCWYFPAVKERDTLKKHELV